MVQKKYKLPVVTMALLTKISGVNVCIDIFNHSVFRFKPITPKDIMQLCYSFKIDIDELFSDLPEECFEPHMEVLRAFGEKYEELMKPYGYFPKDRVQFVHIRQMYEGKFNKKPLGKKLNELAKSTVD
jgi:hypothetical protein